jgi:hypothetical protein
LAKAAVSFDAYFPYLAVWQKPLLVLTLTKKDAVSKTIAKQHFLQKSGNISG